MTYKSKAKLTENLFIAAAQGDIEKLKELIAYGANVHCRTGSLGDNALLKSSLYHGEEEVITLLLNQGLECPEYRKDIELLNALKHYKKTKEILDPLLPCFNQKGTYSSFSLWSGKKVSVGQLIFEKIPKERIHCRDKNGGLHLKTSYYDSINDFRGQKKTQVQNKLVLEYFSIAGSLFVGYCDHLEIPNLETIGGDLALAGGIKSTQGPNLEEIGGGLNLPTKAEINFPRLKQVGKDFWGDGLNISNNPKIEFPRLQKVIGNVKLPHTKQCLLPKLEYVGGDLELPEINLRVTNKDNKTNENNPVKKIKKIFGNIDTNPKLLKLIIKTLPETHLYDWMEINSYEFEKNNTRLLKKIKDEISIRSFIKHRRNTELYLG